MKAFKWLGGLGFFIIVLVVGVGIYVLNNLNMLVKDAVETYGPEVTETRVDLEEVDIKLRKGSAEMNHFKVANPAGFNSPHILKWDKIGIELDTSTVRSEVLVINDLTIKGVNIVAEQKGLTTNIQALLKSLDKGSSSEKSSSSSDSSEGPEIRLALKKLTFTDNSIDFMTEKFGSYRLDIPAVNMANIGDPQKGLTPVEFGQAILKPLLKEAQKSIEEKAKALTKEKLKEKLDEKKAELEAKVDAKKEELKSKVNEEKEQLQAKLDAEQTELDKKKAELEAEKKKLEEEKKELETKAKEKLKGLLDKKPQ